MFDWNVVVTVYEEAFAQARRTLSQFGKVRRSGYYNVLLLKVESVDQFLDQWGAQFANLPELANMVSRVMPAAVTFNFQDRESFEAQARAAALEWVPALANKSFHVRMHRRGFRAHMSSQDEERFLDGILLNALEERGTPGRITFEDPDAIIDVDTVDNRAGLSLWTREDLSRYPFLRLD